MAFLVPVGVLPSQSVSRCLPSRSPPVARPAETDATAARDGSASERMAPGTRTCGGGASGSRSRSPDQRLKYGVKTAK